MKSRIKQNTFGAMVVSVIAGLLLGLPLAAGAQQAEFEFFRTEDAPGFFQLKVFAGPNAEPRDSGIVAIKNYKADEQERYKQTMDIIRDWGNITIISPADRERFGADKYVQLSIGSEIEGMASFLPEGIEIDQNRVRNFLIEHTAREYFDTVELQFVGGNVTDVYSRNTSPLRSSGADFVGRYETNEKTSVLLTVADGTRREQLTATLDFGDPLTVDPQLSYEIPRLWQEIKTRQSSPRLSGLQRRLVPLFPYFLGLLALGSLLLLYMEYRHHQKNLHQAALRWLPYHPLSSSVPRSTQVPNRISGVRKTANRRDFLRNHVLHRAPLGEHIPLEWLRRRHKDM